MRLLLDTHIAIWAVTDDERLSARARALIDDEANTIFVSVASIWEISIKHSLARRPRRIPVSGSEALDLFVGSGFEVLSISSQHTTAVEGLPPLHGDPFDRMIVAQALAEPLVLITADALVAAYGAQILRV